MIQHQNILPRWHSRMMYGICCACALVIVGVLAIICGYLLAIGFKSMHLSLFTHLPSDDPPGMGNAIVGTLILVLLASLLAVPIGMLAGIYLAEYEAESRIASPVRFIADVLAGVPSIVVGVLAYELVVVPTHSPSGWAGALALAFIMIPIVCRTTEEMLRLVPQSYREASIALGASKAKTILGVVVPSAAGSLVTGVLLAIARVAGETAPLLFTVGWVTYMQTDPNKPFPSLTYRIYELSNEPSPENKAQAWAGIVVLLGLILVVNLSVRFFTRRRRFV